MNIYGPPFDWAPNIANGFDVLRLRLQDGRLAWERAVGVLERPAVGRALKTLWPPAEFSLEQIRRILAQDTSYRAALDAQPDPIKQAIVALEKAEGVSPRKSLYATKRRKVSAPKFSGNVLLAVAYIRVSTDDQALGVEAQRGLITRWAEVQGISIGAWVIDEGTSGRTPYPERLKLHEALTVGRAQGAGLLVVAKRDRLARSVMVAMQAQGAAEQAGLQVVSCAGEGGAGVDPASKLLRHMIDAIAEYEADVIRGRITAALDVKRRRGEMLGSVPYGQKLGADGKTLEPCAEEQATMARARELHAQALSLRNIIKTLEAEGHSPRAGSRWHAATVRRWLR